MANTRQRLLVTGLVQGVGFRPFVYRLAQQLTLSGHVRNTSEGVVIEIQGSLDTIDAFRTRLQREGPPLLRIDSILSEEASLQSEDGFVISSSEDADKRFARAPYDVAMCETCRAEIEDPHNRRFGYAFTSCTDCGPRYSILRNLPYDRAQTTMAEFEMCKRCRAEYETPEDRRFHAQAIACPECGPHLWVVRPGQDAFISHDAHLALTHTSAALARGEIVGVKGLGGYQLICNARNSSAVRELRRRKRREEKAFAVMVRNLQVAEMICELSRDERDLLDGPVKPIVLLERLSHSGIAEEVAPGLPTLGVMLPYTPLHELLFDHCERELGQDAVLVVTSGNISDEPILIDILEAERKLSSIADLFVHHDRPIHTRLDDSVACVLDRKPIVLRRARGYCLSPLAVGVTGDDVLACGVQQKSTFCLAKGGHAFLSQHLGDLDNYETLESFRQTLSQMQHLFGINPKIVAHDLHPSYTSTSFARGLAAELHIAVQHHHAHVVSCMAEHGIEEPVIGVAWDGTGYGTDGKMWGSEFLVADRSKFERCAHFRYVLLAGGDRAVKQPWRIARSYLHSGSMLLDAGRLNSFRAIPAASLQTIDAMLQRGFQTIETSSCGRLFDAVGSLLDLHQTVSYEGQAALTLEAIAGNDDGVYDFGLEGDGAVQIDLRPMVGQIVAEVSRGLSASTISARFHNTLVKIVGDVCSRIRKRSGIGRVCLSGGCFQNMRLLRDSLQTLHRNGFDVYFQQSVPCNDGGISLGQAAVACARLGDGTY